MAERIKSERHNFMQLLRNKLPKHFSLKYKAMKSQYNPIDAVISVLVMVMEMA
jgi:hypothetical protein